MFYETRELCDSERERRRARPELSWWGDRRERGGAIEGLICGEGLLCLEPRGMADAEKN